MQTLQNGSTGPAVALLQSDLLALGYDVGPTGIDSKFGIETEAAVGVFQSDTGLPDTGIADDATWNALNTALGQKAGQAVTALAQGAAPALAAAAPAIVSTAQAAGLPLATALAIPAARAASTGLLTQAKNTLFVGNVGPAPKWVLWLLAVLGGSYFYFHHTAHGRRVMKGSNRKGKRR